MQSKTLISYGNAIFLKLTAFALLTASLAPMAHAASPDDALIGQWRSQKRGGVTAFNRCGTAICGQVVDGDSLRANPDLRDVNNGDKQLRSRKVKGLVVLQNFKGGPREWTGGPLYDPDRGMGVKSGTITLVDRDTLKVTGCLARFLCQSEVMTRIR